MWDVDGGKARNVYRLLYDALTDDRQRSALCYKFQYLSSSLLHCVVVQFFLLCCGVIHSQSGTFDDVKFFLPVYISMK